MESIQARLKMEREMEKEFLYILMEINMKENIKMIKEKEKGFYL